MSADHPFQAEIDAVARVPTVPAILDVVCRLTGAGIAIVARVTEERWIACGVLDSIGFGLAPGDEMEPDKANCGDVRRERCPIVVGDVLAVPRYAWHASAPRHAFRAYIAMPIILPDGTFFGTLCALDRSPRRLDGPEITGALRLFAELIAFHIDAMQKLATSDAALHRERAVSELREQFIAVLGHDLRNPLASVAAGTELMRRHPERAPELALSIERSIARMSGLIDNVLDFARGRLGGMSLSLEPAVDIAPTLAHVVDELRNTHVDRAVATSFDVTEPVRCDSARLGQLLSNLLGNALTHGAASSPVAVRAFTREGVFELSVANGGEPIPPAAMKQLFQPFFRGAVRPSQQGLGLGLFIASEIARAHGGQIEAASTAAETRFTFRMPTRSTASHDGPEPRPSP